MTYRKSSAFSIETSPELTALVLNCALHDSPCDLCSHLQVSHESVCSNCHIVAGLHSLIPTGSLPNQQYRSHLRSPKGVTTYILQHSPLPCCLQNQPKLLLPSQISDFDDRHRLKLGTRLLQFFEGVLSIAITPSKEDSLTIKLDLCSSCMPAQEMHLVPRPQ